MLLNCEVTVHFIDYSQKDRGDTGDSEASGPGDTEQLPDLNVPLPDQPQPSQSSKEKKKAGKKGGYVKKTERQYSSACSLTKEEWDFAVAYIKEHPVMYNRKMEG